MMHIVERGQTKMRYELWPSFELPTRRRLGDGALLIGTEGKGARRNLANDERLASPFPSVTYWFRRAVADPSLYLCL